jgi:hypothetical protein
VGEFSVCFYSFCFALKRLFLLQSHARIIYSCLYIKLSPKIYHPSKRECVRERERANDVWSDDASAEKADQGERFVEFDREERRYLFPTHSSEIEWDRS